MIPVLRGEVTGLRVGPGEVYRVEMVTDGSFSFENRVHVEPTGAFEFRSVPVDTYRFRLVNMHNDVITEVWITLSEGFETVTIPMPRRKGETPGTGVVSARALAIKPPKDARKAFDKGAREASKNHYDKAAAYLEEAVRICPEYYQARSNLAVQYIRLQRYPEALEQLNRAAESGVADAVVHANLGYVQLMLEHFDEAVVASRRAIEIEPDRAAPHFILASALLRTKRDYKEAIRHLQVAADSFPQARWMLAAAYAQHRDMASAAVEARRYLELKHPEHRADALKLLNFVEKRP